MAKELSPKKYIETNVRKLPIYKCYINPDWSDTLIANVFVLRKHPNGNVTTGIYLVDLACIGIKDTFFRFNDLESKIDDYVREGAYIEASYNLAHNIVFAGHDFALDYEIKPHPDFATTKFILEEDDDNIPLIEVAVGGPDGNPMLILQPGQSAKYKHVYDKLVKILGKDNFKYIMDSGGFMNHSSVDDDDEYDEDEYDEYDEDYEEKEEDYDEEGDDEVFLDDFEWGLITMLDASEIAFTDLMDNEKIAKRSEAEIKILQVEFCLRVLEMRRSDLFNAKEDSNGHDLYDLYGYAGLYPLWLTEEISEEAYEMIKSDVLYYGKLYKTIDSKSLLLEHFKKHLLESIVKYQHNPYISHILYEKSIVQSNIEAQNILKPIIKKLALQYVSAKLELALCTYYINEPDPSVLYVIEGTDLNKIFPTVERFSEFELNLFAMLRLVVNIRQGNIGQAIYYYRFIGMLNEESPLLNSLQIDLYQFLQEPFKEAIKEMEDLFIK